MSVHCHECGVTPKLDTVYGGVVIHCKCVSVMFNPDHWPHQWVMQP